MPKLSLSYIEKKTISPEMPLSYIYKTKKERKSKSPF